MFGTSKITKEEKFIKESYELQIALKDREIERLQSILSSAELELDGAKRENAFLREAFKKCSSEYAKQKTVDYINGLELKKTQKPKILYGKNPGENDTIISRSDYICQPMKQSE